MSLPIKTNLEEYARQCTLERRHYADCIQQQSDQAEATPWSAWLGKLNDGNQLDRGLEQPTYSSLADLLETPVEPLAWEDERLGLEAYRQDCNEGHHLVGDRSQTEHQTSSNVVRKRVGAVSYGAP